ncbi:MAG: hypothetical protein H3C43_02025 [Leptonema sp. (in: Bacteria)]|nr:hypothetical protein [Leptonema sp. (in: bacteria)]
MDKVEQLLQDVLNAGIALFRAGEGTVNKAIEDVKKNFDELKAKGAADSSEHAVHLRKILDDIVKKAGELGDKANTGYGEAVTQLQDLYGKATVEIEKIVPKEQVDQIKGKVDELTKAIQAKVDEVAQTVKDKTSGAKGGETA